MTTEKQFSQPGSEKTAFRRRSPFAKPTPVGQVLNQVVERRKWRSRLSDARVFTAFAEAAGEQTAAHAKAIRLKSGELTVSVDSASWRQQLAFLSDALVQKTNALLGEPMIRSLRLTHGAAPQYEPLPPLPRPKPLPPPSSDALATADRLSHLIADHELATLLANCYINAQRARD